jgi:hypothetical protein
LTRRILRFFSRLFLIIGLIKGFPTVQKGNATPAQSGSQGLQTPCSNI